jgi:RNA polymerase sigma factor (sigma-70 family)
MPMLLPDVLPPPAETLWTDERLIRECLKGSEEAWNALIDKYRSLIFSVPVKHGLPPDGATDVFQEVCFSLLSSMAEIREPKALAAWLIRTAWHKSLHWRRSQERFAGEEIDDERLMAPGGSQMPGNVLDELEREQLLRDCLRGLPKRCYELIQKLFYESPTRQYKQVAEDLGIAVGSIGFIRGRCLHKLRRGLEEKGFR